MEKDLDCLLSKIPDRCGRVVVVPEFVMNASLRVGG
jgi:hypothetical protein